MNVATSIHLPNVQAQFESTSQLFKQPSHALHLPYSFNVIRLVTSIEKAYLVSSQVSSGLLIYLNTYTQHLI